MSKIIVAPIKRALYFGCRAANSPGHFLMENGRTIYDAPPSCPWTVGNMDGGLLTNGKHPDVYDGKVFWAAGGRPFWYAFVWWDNSGDKRGQSNSGFYVEGFGWNSREDLTPRDDAFAFACAVYPEVVKRQHATLVIVEKP